MSIGLQYCKTENRKIETRQQTKKSSLDYQKHKHNTHFA